MRLVLLSSLVALAIPMTLCGDSPQQGDEVRMVVPSGDYAKYWPRWRGPTSQGLVLSPGNYPDTWSDTDNVLWKIPVPGQGNSSPIIWKDQLFLTTAYENGKKRSILCFDRASGKKLWETFCPSRPPEGAQGKNGWASGTPATDGERVCAFFGNDGVFCVDMSGKQLWHTVLGNMDALHGMACSPLIFKDRIIIYQDHRSPSGSFVVALNKQTGAEIWKSPRKEVVGWGSPVAITVQRKDQIIISSQDKVYAYDPENGKVIWTCAGNLFEVTPTPVVGHGLLFCCSGRAGPTLAIRPIGTSDLTKTDKLVWKSTKGSPFIPSPLLYGDYLYMVNDILSVVTCFEAKTGKLMWQERCGAAVKEGFSSSPVGVDNKVFFTNDDGDTFVLAAGPEFKLLHVNRLNAKVLASPALLDGRWYWRTARELICIGK
jgi:outer membrane protein assembly factor BamB